MKSHASAAGYFYAAIALTWLFAFAGWLLDAFGTESAIGRAVRASIRADLAETTQAVKMIVMLMACAILRTRATVPLARRRHHPRSVPCGFRMRRPSDSMRPFMRGIIAPARGVRARITALLKVLRRLDRCVARLLARIDKGEHGGAFVAVAPPSCLYAGLHIAPATTDSS